MLYVHDIYYIANSHHRPWNKHVCRTMLLTGNEAVVQTRLSHDINKATEQLRFSHDMDRNEAMVQTRLRQASFGVSDSGEYRRRIVSITWIIITRQISQNLHNARLSCMTMTDLQISNSTASCSHVISTRWVVGTHH